MWFYSTINFILAIIHPQLFQADAHTLSWLQNVPDYSKADWAICWPSVYTAMAVISCCIVPLHTDRFGCHRHYDALATLEAEGVKIQFPDIKANFQYDSGTLLFFSGALF